MLENLTNKIDHAIAFVNKIGEWLYRYRYYIAIVLFILCVVLEISGSSIGCWNNFVGSNVTDEGVILGKSRGIRSDEWAVLTPMTLSQFLDGFHYFSDVLRGDQTDVFMVYGLPVLNIMQIFRPFQLGFLFLGMAKGLSFFWCGRLIALFMVTFEFSMLFTKKNKLLSLLGAFMITLAPIVQWWFAVNGIVEIFVFGELAILLLHKYMNTESLKKRCLYLLGLMICAGGYIMVLYPAWQIPMAYVFLALAIWVMVENRKNCKMNYKDIISIIVAILVLAGCMGYIFSQSMETIKTVMNTVYPGSRAVTGGEMLKKYVSYLMNPFLAFKESGIEANTCEAAVMFTLFPIGILLAGYQLIKEKKKDVLLICLLAAYAFLSLYCVFGFPEMAAKLTLLSKSQSKRAMLAVGFIEVLLLLRSLAMIKKPCISRKSAFMIATIITLILVDLCERWNTQYVNFVMCVYMGIMCLYLCYFALRYQAKYAKYLLAGGMIFVMIMAGATVNPVRRGLDVIYDSDIIQKVQEINAKEEGKWITEELGFPIANYLLMAGVPVINCTNTYPNMERWQGIDQDNKYEDVYNRYAHIGIKVRKDENDYEEKFKLINADAFDVYLLPEELEKLKVKYIFTVNELEKFNTDEITFEKVYHDHGYAIYQIK